MVDSRKHVAAIFFILVLSFAFGNFAAAQTSVDDSKSSKSERELGRPSRAKQKGDKPQDARETEYAGDDEEVAAPAPTPAPSPVPSPLAETLQGAAAREAQSIFGLLNYSLVDLLIFPKFGASVGAYTDSGDSWEVEYLRSTLSTPGLVKDLGSMTDERISLTRRSHFGSNSFNISYGLSYFGFSIRLGETILNRLSSVTFRSFDRVEVQSLGLNIGVGNRWVFDRYVLGVDWISWAQPFYSLKRESGFLNYATNESDRQDVDSAMKLVEYLPRITLLKVTAGLSF